MILVLPLLPLLLGIICVFGPVTQWQSGALIQRMLGVQVPPGPLFTVLLIEGWGSACCGSRAGRILSRLRWWRGVCDLQLPQ